jgi:hypothetical protein
MRECGQTIVEWLAVLAGVVTLATGAAVAVPSIAPAVTGGMQTEICRVAGGSCDGPPGAAAAAPAPFAAQPPVAQHPAAPASDFCGSSWFNAPELWFTSACEGHDRCYAAHSGKAACDTAFLHDMLAVCATVGSSSAGGVSPGITRASCRAAAHLYYKAVVIGGGFSYCHRPVCREQ